MTWDQRVLLCAIVCAVAMAACSRNESVRGRAALQHAAEEFIPEDAQNRIIAPNLPWVQLSFDVRRSGQQFAMDEKRIFDAQEKGWTLCTGSGWQAYEDSAATPSVYVEQKFYVLYKDGVELTLVSRYEKPISGEAPVQQGSIIARNITEQDALAFAAKQGLTCDSKERKASS